MSSSAKKWISRLVKIAVCAGALWYLSTKVTLNDYVRLADEPTRPLLLISQDDANDTLRVRDPESSEEREVPRSALAKRDSLQSGQREVELGLKTIARTLDWSWGRWALLAFGPVPFILGWRLRCLLRTQSIDISMRDAILLTFAGNFFNFAMPGTTGGDLYKAYHIAKRTDKRTEGITIVILDRVIGLISFLLLAAIAIFAARGTEIVGEFGRWVGYLLTALILVGLLFFSKRVRAAIRYDALIARLPLADKIRRIDETAFSFRYQPKTAVITLLATVLSHFCIITCIYFLARSFGIHPNLGRSTGELYLATFISTVVGYLFAAIPISFQGFGLLELVFTKVMVGGDWCTASQMLALTLSARLVQVIWSLPGILVPWFGLERPPEESEGGSEAVEELGEPSAQ